MEKEEKVAIDYKGKHFIICDKSNVDELDIVDEEVDVQDVIQNHLRDYVEDCIYYGIPSYIGNDQELHEKIKVIDEELDTSPFTQDNK